jgi:hypothetical protein
VHDAFERAMEWVFRKCRTLSPRTAFYVIIAAMLWLPISLGVATAVHALLLTNAAALPAWMQLLHPFATVIAKSKLLVLPVYPAAWPQAKKHPFIQIVAKAYRDFESLFFIRKLEHRYRQTERAIATSVDCMHRFADRTGLRHGFTRLRNRLGSVAVRAGAALQYRLTKTFERLSKARLIGPLISSYASHLTRVERRDEKISEKVRRGFEKWFVKFSAEYYDARETARAPQAAPAQKEIRASQTTIAPLKASESPCD